MSEGSIGRGMRLPGSTRLHGARYVVALAVLVALTVSSFVLMRAFVIDERALDATMEAIGELRVELATQQITMRDLVEELRHETPDEVRLRGFRRALSASRERLFGGHRRLEAAMTQADVAPSAWRVLKEAPYNLDKILGDMSMDVHVALQDANVPADEDIVTFADPHDEGFLTITDSHATAARLAAERLITELRNETEQRKIWRERVHGWLGWATVLVLFAEAFIIFWPLLGNLGREARRADEATNELARLARHDALTGLINRASLIGEMERAIERADPTSERLAVMLIDLDRFKPINDMFGHAAGDEVLIEVARRLQASLRPRDVVARLGGDEFVVLLPRSGTDDDVHEIGLRINRSLGREMEIEGHRLHLGASIGCAFWPVDARDVDGLLSAADLAMYRAKRADRDDPVFFDEELRSDVARFRSEEADLRRAIAENELDLCYQPIVSLDGSTVHGFEALVRWNHQTFGVVGPDRFLPIAERAGLMTQITTWVLDHACRQMARWREQDAQPGLMSINVADAFLTQPDAVARVLEVAARHGVEPSSLALEVSERVVTGDENTPIALKLDDAHASGLRIALDEFGLGQASLIHLRKPGIDILKIDRAFVRDLTSAPETAAIVGAMIQLGRILDKQIVVEGVETAEQAALLAVSESAWVQGFLFSRPLDADEATAFMAERRDRAAAPRPRLRSA